MKIFTYLYTFLLFFVLSCDISKNDVLPTNTFTKIYDDDRFEQEYYPLDIIQTADEGFLILSELKNDQSLFTSVLVIKTDAIGSIISETEMSSPNVMPVNGWQKVGESYYFVCMNENSTTAQLVAVSEDGTLSNPLPLAGITYPLAVTSDGTQLTILSYDNRNAQSVISVASTTGQISQQKGYTIGAGVDVEKPIIDHLTRNGDILPFRVGQTKEGLFYFNGFYNYTFSLVFTNFGDDPTGVCQGQLSQGGISEVASLGNNIFGIARFNFGDNYIAPLATIPTNATTSSTDLEGNTFPEMENKSKVKLLDVGTEGKWLYTTTTQANQVVLYGFNQTDGTILGTSYLGNGNPYTMASVITTLDGGIAVLAQTSLEGRFRRIAIFKRDKAFLDGLIR
ncbi:MAG: hypothetical protein L3J06_06775 [Cyclobacteriaceae bacterium]|nr:hypothetical protein [Cyclobacteriaceae bacterium]